jgi:hypothetical protein
MKREELWAYVRKGILWYAGNLVFGSMPILFLGLVSWASQGKLGFDDMQKEIHKGAVLFVCISMMGGVMVDLLQSETKFSGQQIVAKILTPIFIMGVLLLEYLFIVLKIINTDCFNITSRSSVFLLGFSMMYCIVIKIKLSITEDTKYE